MRDSDTPPPIFFFLFTLITKTCVVEEANRGGQERRDLYIYFVDFACKLIINWIYGGYDRPVGIRLERILIQTLDKGKLGAQIISTYGSKMRIRNHAYTCFSSPQSNQLS